MSSPSPSTSDFDTSSQDGFAASLDIDPAASPATSTTLSTTHTHSDSDRDDASPPRKRARISKSKSKRMHGFLAGIVHVPMDIFAQITSFLQPIDIHSLARTNKKFRSLLMNSSSRHIWRAAEQNVPGLPPCPQHLTEPQYAALVFGKWCSMCAATANASRRMDPMLSVRLCSNCRDKNVVGSSFVPQSVIPFVTFSRGIKSPTHANPAYTLIGQVNWAVSIAFEFATRGQHGLFEQWKRGRIAQLEVQLQFARALTLFLDVLDEQRIDEIEELKAKRFTAIKGRLMVDGWDEVDCHVTHLPLFRDWEKLVFQPKLLTNRTWDNIKPKLEPILHANRKERLVRERYQRKRERKARLGKLFAELVPDHQQFIELGEEYDQPFGLPETLVMPVPDAKTALKHLNAMKQIVKQDISGDAAEEAFMAKRDGIVNELNGWRFKLARQLADDLSSEDYELGGLLLGRMKFRIGVPEPPVVLSTQFTTQSEQYTQNQAVRKLLRADSVFCVDDEPTCHFFPDIIRFVQVDLVDRPPPPYLRQRQNVTSDDSDAESNHVYYFEDEVYVPKAMDLSRVHQHTLAHNAAKRLLACLGKPDAAYIEMKALGRRFVCGRCWVKKPMTWAEMLEHYSQHMVYNWPFSTAYTLQQRGIECLEEHTVHKQGQAWRDSTLGRTCGSEGTMADSPDHEAMVPLVEIVSWEEADAAELEFASPEFACDICNTVADAHEEGVNGKPIPRPKGSKQVILEHLENVHRVPKERRERWTVACAQQ